MLFIQIQCLHRDGILRGVQEMSFAVLYTNLTAPFTKNLFQSHLFLNTEMEAFIYLSSAGHVHQQQPFTG